jgi:hypothetical protein
MPHHIGDQMRSISAGNPSLRLLHAAVCLLPLTACASTSNAERHQQALNGASRAVRIEGESRLAGQRVDGIAPDTLYLLRFVSTPKGPETWLVRHTAASSGTGGSDAVLDVLGAEARSQQGEYGVLGTCTVDGIADSRVFANGDQRTGRIRAAWRVTRQEPHFMRLIPRSVNCSY